MFCCTRHLKYVFSCNSSSSSVISSGGILVYSQTNHTIDWIAPDTTEREALITVEGNEPFSNIGTEAGSENFYILLSGGYDTLATGVGTVLNYNLKNQSQISLIEMRNVLGMQFSPNTDRAILTYLSPTVTSFRRASLTSTYKCILNLTSGTCFEIHGTSGLAYWLSNDIVVLNEDRDNTLLVDVNRMIKVPFQIYFPSSQRAIANFSRLILIPNQINQYLTSSGERYLIYDFNTQETEYYDILPNAPYRPSDVLFSNNGQYVSMPQPSSSIFIRFDTGELISEMRYLGVISWLPNNEQVVASHCPDGFYNPCTLVRYHIFSSEYETLMPLEPGIRISVIQ